MGGAKNCPETPRQKMIGMMYLVLTAMLALNVSADIINGYAAVDDSLHRTMDNIAADNDWYIEHFQASMQQNPEKTREWYGRALKVQEQADSVFNQIQRMKDRMVQMADGADAIPNASVRQMNKKDDTNIPHQFGLNEGNGVKLKETLMNYRQFLLESTDNDVKVEKELWTTFDMEDKETKDGEKISWEVSLFHEMPVCATMTMLTKFQNDVRTEENKILTWLWDNVDAGDLRVNKMSAYVIPKSDYVIEGGKYSAKIIMAAIDSTQKPDYYVNGQKLEGDGIYEVAARGVGEHKFTGQIAYTTPSGESEMLDFESSYTVGEPTVSISNTEMNIMYRGFENKFNISVPGIAPEKLHIDVQGAAVSKKGSLWIIKPGENSKQVVVNVKADVDGKQQPMGSKTYRVKQLPDPSAFFVAGGKSYREGSVPKKNLTSSDSYLEASYGEDGILDLDFQIVSFTLAAGNKLMDSKSGKFTPEQINYIKGMRSGEMLSIMSVRAKGPDGKIKSLNAIPLSIR